MNQNTENIKTRMEFVKFLKNLCEDFCNNQNAWENITLKDYLEALCAYTEDIDGYYKNNNIPFNADIASWRIFADILKGASIYE